MSIRKPKTTAKSQRGATDIEATPIAIRSRTPLSARMKQTVREQLAVHLEAQATLIERVTVRFDDVNGPRGGEDIDCEIKVVLSDLPSAIVTERGESPAAAFARALPRVKRMMRKELDRRGHHVAKPPRGRAKAVDAPPVAPRPPVDAESLIGRGVGRGPAGLARALARPEKQRRDALIDTAAPGVSESDRRAGGAHSARRNSRASTAGMTVALEDSMTRPSRKSTRRSVNGGNPSEGKARNAVAQMLKPSARSARDAARRGGPARH